MGIEKDKLLQKMIIVANPYSDKDINTIVYKTGEISGTPNPSL